MNNKAMKKPLKKSVLRLMPTFSVLAMSVALLAQANAADFTSSDKEILIKRNTTTNSVNFISGRNNKPITISINNGDSLSTSIANQFSQKFGVTGPNQKLQLINQKKNNNNGQKIRYQQYYQGLPVIGAEVIANTNAQNQLMSMTGKSSQTLTDKLNINPTITSQEAVARALLATSTWHKIEVGNLSSTTPELSILDISLIGPGDRPALLAWKLEVRSSISKVVNEFIVVNANSSEILLHFNQVDSALDRKTYSAVGVVFISDLPGTLVCDETNPTCAGESTDSIAAHKAAADIYNFYKQNHNRDSIDNKGMTITQSVELGAQVNAFWAGPPLNQLIFFDGMTAGMDVVAHEYTHGVTQFESNLFYYYQTGAISESFSDIWGELIDQKSNPGKAVDLRWLIGDEIGSRGTKLLFDLSGNPQVAIRSMKDPTVYGDPDKMSSVLYHLLNTDNGGVHVNSGINNKAVFLMTDGGTFNGVNNIQPLGAAKVTDIYYQAQTMYLTSSSNYIDLYNALIQSCSDLVNLNNTPAISTADCSEMKKALDAVEMNQNPAIGYIQQAQLCSANLVPKNIFYDDMEATSSNWVLASLTSKQHAWALVTGYSTSGNKSLNHTIAGLDLIPNSAPEEFNHLGTIHDTASMKNAFTLPTQVDSYLHFSQAFGYPDTNDAAVIEYSLNGSNWIDANSLITDGKKYTGTSTKTVSTYPSKTNTQAPIPLNPLAGKNGFVNDSHGFNSTRLTLPSARFGGKSIKFRWRVGSDNYLSSLSMNIDDVRIYSCVTNTPPSANAGADLTKFFSVNSSITGTGSDAETLKANLIYSWKQIAGDTVTNITGANTATISFTTPASATTVTFELTVKDESGDTATDTVDIIVKAKPVDPTPTPSPGTANSDSGGCVLNKNAAFDPLLYILLMLFSIMYFRNKYNQN